jgi:hypothetical protein
MAEAAVRSALRDHLLAGNSGAEALDEFWIPRSHERADVAVIGRMMAAYEIKTDRDTLRRLPRQADAYGRIFDRCTAVVAAKHAAAATEMLPEWWGVTEVSVNGSVSFHEKRAARPNPGVDPEILIRLLWRAEVVDALARLGVHTEARATRSSLWLELLRVADLTKLRAIVRRALVHRMAAVDVRVSRFMRPSDACGADQ